VTSVRRVILFDIDGTLVWGGPAKEAFVEAMRDTFGTAGDSDGVSFAGKTDPQIARELLVREGLDASDIEVGFPDLWDRYTTNLAERLVELPMDVLPGVPELLAALSGRDDVGMGLLTGNIERGAQLKLGSAGLLDHFELGSYGSDHEERDELPAVAMERARSVWQSELTAADAIIVGDTPRDVTCGLAGGMRTLAVATGHFGASALEEAGAYHVVEDLTDVEALLSVLLS
jgi:phosphoglycolate phosphatase